MAFSSRRSRPSLHSHDEDRFRSASSARRLVLLQLFLLPSGASAISCPSGALPLAGCQAPAPNCLVSPVQVTCCSNTMRRPFITPSSASCRRCRRHGQWDGERVEIVMELPRPCRERCQLTTVRSSKQRTGSGEKRSKRSRTQSPDSATHSGRGGHHVEASASRNNGP